MVEDYRDARQVDLQQLELTALGYAEEERDYRRDVGVRTFLGWLTGGGWTAHSLREPDDATAR